MAEALPSLPSLSSPAEIPMSQISPVDPDESSEAPTKTIESPATLEAPPISSIIPDKSTDPSSTSSSPSAESYRASPEPPTSSSPLLSPSSPTNNSPQHLMPRPRSLSSRENFSKFLPEPPISEPVKLSPLKMSPYRSHSSREKALPKFLPEPPSSDPIKLSSLMMSPNRSRSPASKLRRESSLDAQLSSPRVRPPLPPTPKSIKGDSNPGSPVISTRRRFDGTRPDVAASPKLSPKLHTELYDLQPHYHGAVRGLISSTIGGFMSSSQTDN